MSVHNQEERDKNVRKLVSAARSILANEVALPQGCVRMAKILYWLRPTHDLNYPIIDEYLEALRATDAPLGADRLHWDRHRLAERDVALWAVTERYRARIVEVCWDILDLAVGLEGGGEAPRVGSES